jgi:hypothetical protein
MSSYLFNILYNNTPWLHVLLFFHLYFYSYRQFLLGIKWSRGFAVHVNGRHADWFSFACLTFPFPIPSLRRCLAGPSGQRLIPPSCRWTWVETWPSLFPTRAGWIVYLQYARCVAYKINIKIHPVGSLYFLIYCCSPYVCPRSIVSRAAADLDLMRDLALHHAASPPTQGAPQHQAGVCHLGRVVMACRPSWSMPTRRGAR